MTSSPRTSVLVVMVGPQASGKSTLAGALSADLRERGELVALIELDQIAAMALPTLPSWDAAHRVFESTAAAWVHSGSTVVVAEGSGSLDEVTRLLRRAPPGAATVTVVVSCSFEVAFDRAVADPTRGVSKEYAFLHAVYERWPREMARIPADAVVDSTVLSVAGGVADIRTAIASARARAGSPPRSG